MLIAGAVAVPVAAAGMAIGDKAAATTLTDSGETSLLFDNCSYLDTTTLVKNAETQIMASSYIALNKAPVADKDQAIVLSGAVYLIPGPGCTGVYLRLRRGFGLAGAIDYEIGDGGLYLPPGKLGVIPIHGIMDPTVYIPGPAQYTTTVEQVNATGNGRIVFASLSFTYVGFDH
jgi:hypothetical protein